MFISSALLESAVIDGVLRVLLIIELITDLGKPFHEVNLLMMLISGGNLSVKQTRDARVRRPLVHGGRYVHGTKLVKLTYRGVFVFF